jgi:L-aminopeptidase/D-esterase-like protein
MTGISWIEETGTFAGPVLLTNTHDVGIAHAAVVAWTVEHHPDLAERWLLPVVAETWDGYLNDINGQHVTKELALAALDAASGTAIDEGSVGGGTGMNCYEYKGGSGTASRIVTYGGVRYSVGVLLQANFGRRSELTLAGVPVGEALAGDNPMADYFAQASGGGSVVTLVATDAPMLPHQCKALARRVSLGLARTGTTGSHFSGDLFLAFSTANRGSFGDASASDDGGPPDQLGHLSFIPWGSMDLFYEAVVQGVEEAVADALVANEEMVGRSGHRTPALPRSEVARLMAAKASLPA